MNTTKNTYTNRRIYLSSLRYILVLFLLGGFCSCHDDKDDAALLVKTGNTTDVSYNSVSVDGEVIQGNADLRGICWNTNGNPTMNDTKTTAGSGKGKFTVSLTGLDEGTIYYIRAYAVDGSQIEYGDIKQIQTYQKGSPSIGITDIEDIGYNSASFQVRVLTDGGVDVTQRGLCWSPKPNPDLESTFNTEGTGSTGFTSTITGLEPETKYYIRPYVKSGTTTRYGSQIIIMTKTLLKSLIIKNIEAGSFSATGSIEFVPATKDMTIQELGIAWASSDNPTLENGNIIKFPDSNEGLHAFSIPGLSCEKTYFARAYCKINDKVYYSATKTFSTIVTYEYYIGNWEMSFTTEFANPNGLRDAIEVQLIPKEDGVSYILKGWLAEPIANMENVDIVLQYNKESRELEMNAQVYRSDNSYDYWLIASNEEGKFSAKITYGFIGKKESGKDILNMTQNGKWDKAVGMKLCVKYAVGTTSGNKGQQPEGNGGNGNGYYYIVFTKK